MSARLVKLRRLAQRLAAKTETGELRWQRSAKIGSYQTAFPDSAIVIERTSALLTTYAMHVLDANGTIVESLNGSEVPGFEDGNQGNLQVLGRLFDVVARSADKVDPTVDRLLERLGA